MQERLRKLFGDENGGIRPELVELYRALTATERPDTVAARLDRGGGPAILRQLQAGALVLSHEALDETVLPAFRHSDEN